MPKGAHGEKHPTDVITAAGTWARPRGRVRHTALTVCAPQRRLTGMSTYDRPYTFYFHDEVVARGVPSFEVVPCTGDEEAKVLALDLLKRHPARHAVEVWAGDRRVLQITDAQISN